jgi:hypothetical protein
VYLLVFDAYINEIHGSRIKIPSKKPRPYVYIYIYIHVIFLALLGAPYIYDISRLRVKVITLLGGGGRAAGGGAGGGGGGGGRPVSGDVSI